MNKKIELKDEIKEMQTETLNKLKSLRLPGFVEEYRTQIENPNTELLSFDERFKLLVSREVNLRYDKKFNKFLRNAKLKYTDACFDNSLYDPSRNLDTNTIELLNTCSWIDSGKNLLITGYTGTGKSYYSNALAIAALKEFKTVKYVKANQLLLEYDALVNRASSEQIMEFIDEYNEVDLLIIDDFGLMSLDIEKCRFLFEILDCRERRRSTIVISQLPVSKWYELFTDRTYADACLDRLVTRAYRLEFSGPSLRKEN